MDQKNELHPYEETNKISQPFCESHIVRYDDAGVSKLML